MSRESRRDRERLERRHEGGEGAERGASASGATSGAKDRERSRTSPPQYVREVRGELRRVHWPNRRELAQYSAVVLVAVILLTAYIFAIDQLFGQIVLWIFA